ncbi:MAG TPA: phosphoribosyl-AMP cyclohydrolase [Anaerolineae bacterium]|nr:phosphoribosyl-AMP cyclohydrolase [Anaerolineae bacterium]
MSATDQLHWNEDGLIPAIVQDISTQQVLMLGWMNPEALRLTMTSGYVTFWSRSRQELWRKGETSGNVMLTTAVHFDCDGDALLVQAAPNGPACHTGNTSCFYRQLSFDDVLAGNDDFRAASDEPAFTWPAEAAQGADD